MMHKVLRKSSPFVSNQVRMAHVPSIRFIGKRHPCKWKIEFKTNCFYIVNKHIGINDPYDGPSAAVSHQSDAGTGAAKALSPDCQLNSDVSHAAYERRLQMSHEEMDIINQGTNDCFGWEDIKLWELWQNVSN